MAMVMILMVMVMWQYILQRTEMYVIQSSNSRTRTHARMHTRTHATLPTQTLHTRAHTRAHRPNYIVRWSKISRDPHPRLKRKCAPSKFKPVVPPKREKPARTKLWSLAWPVFPPVYTPMHTRCKLAIAPHCEPTIMPECKLVPSPFQTIK